MVPSEFADLFEMIRHGIFEMTVSKEKEEELELPFCDEDCEACCACDELDGYDACDETDPETFWGIPDIRRVIFNDPATVIFWDDGTKTVVKCAKDQQFERYAGFIAACAKKLFGSTSRAKAIMEECAYDQPKHEPKPRSDRYVPDLTQALNEVIANKEAAEEAVNEALAR